MASRLAISYLIFSQYSKISVTYQISLLGQNVLANKVGVPKFLFAVLAEHVVE
jgi:hypothetical protein